MNPATMRENLELTPEFRTKPFEVSVKAMEPFVIEHELGRVPAGWLVINCNHATDVWRSGEMNTSILELTANQDADITLVLL